MPDATPYGLVACDGSGTLIFRKPVPGFDVPRYGAACPLWPLFSSLQRPMTPVRQTITMSGRDNVSFMADAISEITYPTGFDGPAVVESWMLIKPLVTSVPKAVRVGTSCRVCSEKTCPARREPSVFSDTMAEAL